MSDIKEFTIDRSRWYRGNGPDGSQLLLPGGSRCCLGFLGQACGVELEALYEVPLPVTRQVSGGRGSDEWPPWLFDRMPDLLTREWRDKLAGINDATHLIDAEREQLLTEIFAAHGVTVRFVDGPEGGADG